MDRCPFCWPIKDEEIILEYGTCVYITNLDQTLPGSGMIVPKAHRETVFDVTDQEMVDSLYLLKKAKQLLEVSLKPDGYTVGWNCRPAAGQTVPHAHLHVIPRFKDEPLAGRGIRHHLIGEANKR